MISTWKKYEERFIALYPVTPLDELILIFPFAKSAIRTKAVRLKLKKSGRIYSWRYSDELRLIELYANTTNAEIGKLLNKTESAVSGAAFKLGLKKTPEFMRKHAEKGMFKKGQTPINKGKKQVEFMSAEAIERTKKTRFKKGNLPHNSYNEVNKVVVRPDKNGKAYKYICIKVGKWVLLHRHLWEQVNGPIPKSHCIWFKDTNPLNCDIENLECITRKENRLRNSGHVTLTPNYLANKIVGGYRKEDKDQKLKELVLQYPNLLEAKKQQLLLNRKIKQHGTKQVIRP